MPLRVLHCPVNLAGVGWTNVQALRRKGVDARLLLYFRSPFRPDEHDVYVDRPASFWRRQLVQLRTLAQVLPQTDIFHFYFGLTLVPKKLQFPILKATRRKSLFHFLGADIRERPKEQLLYGLKADARVRQTEEHFGLEVPIVRATKDDLVEKLRPLVESFEERKRLGAAGRAYVEQVHDLENVADRF